MTVFANAKRGHFIAILLLMTLSSAAQENQKRFKLGMSTSFFWNRQSDYKYILQQNSVPLEIGGKKKKGLMLSTVGMVKPFFNKKDNIQSFKNNFEIVVSLSIFDAYNSKVNLFNKVSPGGAGLGYSTDNIHFIALINYGQINRMSGPAYLSQQFPLDRYPRLVVNGEIPEDILQPYVDPIDIWFFNVGIAVDFQ